jgi:maltose alpha-D-glucosyltransferase/alpha-amylase
MVEGKRWGPAAVNVAAQRRDDDSLLNWMERLIRRRRETPEIACGAWSLLPVREATVLAMRYDWGPRTVIIVHNLAEAPCSLSFEVGEAAGWKGLIDLFGRGAFSLKKDGTVTVELESYGCRWFRVRREDEVMLL